MKVDNIVKMRVFTIDHAREVEKFRQDFQLDEDLPFYTFCECMRRLFPGYICSFTIHL